MSEVTERSVISAENYDELKTMIQSNDDASKNLALTIMEQSDYDKSEIYILCLLKESQEILFKRDKSFKEVFPDLYDRVSNRLLEEATEISTLSFRKVYEIAVKRNNQEELRFLLNIFSNEVKSILIDYGFNFLDYFDVQLVPKSNPDAN